jgi:hypothetical protein
MHISHVEVGQEVTLGGYPDDWLVVQRSEVSRLKVCRRFGDVVRQSGGFWIDLVEVREVRASGPVVPPTRTGRLAL